MKKTSSHRSLHIHSPLSKKILIAFSLLIPLSLAVLSLLGGHVSLWYDPARDLLSAWDNLSDPTLIGPTSGIPGIFYGPYWIWLLSVGMLFSKDPGVIAFITASLPYLIIFPLLWFRFSKIWGLAVAICGWLLFMISTGETYATQLWNPYPAPLLTLAVIYLLSVIDFQKLVRKHILLALLIGFLTGVIINFHISFGIGLLCGLLFFLLITTGLNLRKTKQKKQLLMQHLLWYLLIGGGLVMAYLPALLFEVRHGFNQTQVLLNALVNYGDVVSIKGLEKTQILQQFSVSLSKVLQIPAPVVSFLLVTLPFTYIVLLVKRKITINQTDIRILTVLLSSIAGILFIYLTARNPVWEYHFIGVEVLLLMILLFFMSKIGLYRYALIIWTIGIVSISIYTQFTTFNPSANTGFVEQKKIVTTIKADAKDDQYGAIAYSPSIYMYDYSYLFRWLADKDVPYDPSANEEKETIYLIVPRQQDAKTEDFINFRTPKDQYETEKSWEFQYNIILKRVKNKESMLSFEHNQR